MYIVRGHIQFKGGDQIFDAREGDSFVVPGGMDHQASAAEESEVLDVFAPFRDDYAVNSWEGDERTMKASALIAVLLLPLAAHAARHLRSPWDGRSVSLTKVGYACPPCP